MFLFNCSIFSGKCVGIHHDLHYISKFGFIFVYQDKKLIRVKFFSFLFFFLDLPLVNLIVRVLRKNVISGISNNKFIFIWSRKRYYFFSRSDLFLLKSDLFSDHHSPLQPIFTSPDSGDVICGEYKSNYNREDTFIYMLSPYSKKVIVYKFTDHLIEHIHSFVQINPFCFYVLCGDFDESASIWILDLLNKNCTRLFFNDQIYRAGCGHNFTNGFIYATDSSSISNSLMLYKNDILDKIHTLPSSVIYGVGLGDFFAFSTNLECSLGSRNNFFTKWFINTPPDMFETKSVHLFLINNNFTLKLLAKLSPTFLPWRLFQYPTARVHISADRVIYSLQSISGLHDKCIVFKFSDL